MPEPIDPIPQTLHPLSWFSQLFGTKSLPVAYHLSSALSCVLVIFGYVAFAHAACVRPGNWCPWRSDIMQQILAALSATGQSSHEESEGHDSADSSTEMLRRLSSYYAMIQHSSMDRREERLRSAISLKPFSSAAAASKGVVCT